MDFQNQNNATQQVNVHQLMEKFRSKKEIYNFLAQDYSTNIYFLKQIIQGEKEYLKRTDINVASVPQIEGLAVQDFLDFAKGKQSIEKYLPEEDDLLHVDKRWICDIMYTLDNDGIQKMIDTAKKSRLQKIEQSQDLLINMRPEFVAALKNSLSFSTEKGRAAYLIKNSSKRKRKRKDMEELKQEEEEIKVDKSGYMSKSKQMKTDIQQKDNQILHLKGYEDLVNQLHRRGLIDENGMPLMRQ